MIVVLTIRGTAAAVVPREGIWTAGGKQCERKQTIGSSSVTLLPGLESLEAYHLANLTDDDLDVIMSRINAFKQREIAALKYISRGQCKKISRILICAIRWELLL